MENVKQNKTQKLPKKRSKERPGREIKLDGKTLGNNKLTIRIGTAENKNSPETVYINTSFWVDIKNKDCESENFDQRISREYSKEINNIYRNELRPLLEKSKYFPFFNENIFMYDFPENLNYNNKKSFTLIELNLHTANCIKESNKKLPLKNKGSETELFEELIKVAKTIANSDLLKNKKNFSIHKTKKS